MLKLGTSWYLRIGNQEEVWVLIDQLNVTVVSAKS